MNKLLLYEPKKNVNVEQVYFAISISSESS